MTKYFSGINRIQLVEIQILLYSLINNSFNKQEHMTQSTEQILELNLNSSFNQINNEYPGIIQMRDALKEIDEKGIHLFAEFIRYNIPKSYYPQILKEIDEKIQEIYYRNIDRPERFVDQYIEAPAEMIRKRSPISDEEQAQNLKIVERVTQKAQKYSIDSLKQFITGFKDVGNKTQNVNINLRDKIESLKNRNKQNCVMEIKNQQKINMGVKRKQIKKRQQKQQIEKPQIRIMLGQKIPLDVKQMRTSIKQKCKESFAIKSVQRQMQQTQIQARKVSISFSLNKVTKANRELLFQDIYQIIASQQTFGQFLVSEILKKSIEQPKMTLVYVQFICLFTKIRQAEFSWGWASQKIDQVPHINCIHRILVEKLQRMFEKNLSSQSCCNLKQISFVIGSLIKKRKLSRRIFKETLNHILGRILAESKQSQVQNCYESLIILIESMGNIYEEYEHFDVQDLLDQTTMQKLRKAMVINLKQCTLFQLLSQLIESQKLKSLRIKCLLMNMLTRRNRSQDTSKIEEKRYESENYEQNQKKEELLSISDMKKLLNKEDGMKQISKLFSGSLNSKNLGSLILALSQGSKISVMANIEYFLQSFSSMISSESLLCFWKESYMRFVYEESDLPMLTECLKTIFTSYFKDRASEICIISASQYQGSEDQEDISYFMKKLQKHFN